MTLILQTVSIIMLCSPSFAEKLVLMRPPGLDSFFLELRSGKVPAEATVDHPLPDDPIPIMTEKEKIDLCEDLSKAKLFLTEEDYTSLSNFDYPFPHPMDVEHKPTYKLHKPFVGDDEVPMHLLSCSPEPGVYLSYGFTDHYYFAFTADHSNDNDAIRLLAIVEPIPTNELEAWSPYLVSKDFWRSTRQLDVETWMEEIVLFQHMELSQQFRLCGLAYEHWGEVSRESEGQTKYKIRLPNNLVTDRYLPVLYGTIDYVTPALNCHIIDDSRNQDTRYSVVPNPGDEYSVLLADSREIDQEDADPVIKILTLKNNLTNVSCLYENDDLFHEITYLDYLRRIVRRLLFPSQ